MSNASLPPTAAGLSPAPYNPRRIGDRELRELGKMMTEYGDLSGIVWNKRTGHLVGAHQRVKNIPPSAAITWEPNRPSAPGEQWGYIEHRGHVWNVRGVDWPEEKEKRANIIANNPMLQGEFEMDTLAKLLVEVGYQSAGFTELQIESSNFTDEQLEEILGRPSIMEEQQPEVVNHAAEQINAMAQAGDEAREEKASVMREVRARMKAKQEETSYFRVIIFANDAEANEFMQLIGYNPQEKYISGQELKARLCS